MGCCKGCETGNEEGYTNDVSYDGENQSYYARSEYCIHRCKVNVESCI